VLVGIVALPLMGTSLIPSFKDRDVLVRLDSEPGTSNPKMTQLATQVSREVRKIPGVGNVGAHVGRAITSDQIGDVNSAEVWVSIDSGADYDATIASIEDTVGRVQSARSDVVTYTTQKVKDVGALSEGDNPVTGDGLDLLTGSDKPLAVRVFGQDQGVLRREANKVRQVVSGVDGVSDSRIELPATQPNLEIEVDLEKARREGIKPGDVRRAEATLLQGIEVGSVFEDQKVFEVIVKGTPETRSSVADVRNLLIDKPEGGHVRLGDVADVRVVQTPAVIKRDAVSRYLDVEADISGRSVSDVASEIDDRLANVSLPLEYHAEVLKQTTSEEINTTAMLVFGLGCAIAIFLLLQAGFGGWRLAALAFLTLPVAFVGGALAALIDGAELSLGAVIGFLALFGLATRNGLVLIRRFQDLQRHGGETLGPELIRRGAGERLTPILTTAVALALLALPFVVMGSRPGLEIVHPMAVVLLGGLVTTTLLGLFVLPALYLRFAVPIKPSATPEEELLYRWAAVEPEPAAATAGGGSATATLAGDGAADGRLVPADGDGTSEAAGAERETAS
jgi:Cu/Ag efflux pump CusA